MPWSHGSNITNLNHYSLSFPDAKMTASLRMCFCQINTTKVVQSRPIKMGWLWTKRDFVARKTYSNFSCQNSNNLWHDAQIKQWFAHPWTHWEKLTFNQSFVSKHQFFLLENCCIDNKKEGQKSWGHLENFWRGEQNPSVTDLGHKQLATWLL